MTRRVYLICADECLDVVRQKLQRLCTVKSLKPSRPSAMNGMSTEWRIELESPFWPKGPYGLAHATVEYVRSADGLTHTELLRIVLPAEEDPAP